MCVDISLILAVLYQYVLLAVKAYSCDLNELLGSIQFKHVYLLSSFMLIRYFFLFDLLVELDPEVMYFIRCGLFWHTEST